MVDRQRRIWALGFSIGGTTTLLGCYRLTLATGIDGPLFALEKQVWNLTALAGIEQAAFAFYHSGDESIVILRSASNRLWKWDIASETVVAERTLGFTVDQWNTSHSMPPSRTAPSSSRASIALPGFAPATSRCS
jgi:hypothetical protein